MNNWQSNFSTPMLNEGLEYARNGRVKILNQSNDYIEAIIIGHDDYRTSIKFEKGEIKSVFCTCPYFLREGNCKHLTATLYSIENRQEDMMS